LKKIAISVFLALAMVLSLVSAVFAAFEEDPRDIEDATRVFKFNIIGVKNPKDAELKDDNGSRIFVDLNDKSAIYLVESGTGEASDIDPEDFAILDANATDADGALLAMPDPDLDPYNLSDKGEADTMSAYSIYIRSLGKPGGKASITTCAELLDSDFAGLLSGQFVRTLNRAGAFGGYASVEQVSQTITERPKGKSKWYNVTAELTTIVFMVEVEIGEDDNGNGVIDPEESEIITEYIRVPIFDDIIGGEYWEYDNDGLKNLQVWIYDNSTDVSLGDGAILGD
jgi:hypothetical protein